MLPEILTIEQASEYLQLALDKTVNELEQKRLPGIKIAGEWRIKRAELDKLFESPSPSSQPTTPAKSQTPSSQLTTPAKSPLLEVAESLLLDKDNQENSNSSPLPKNSVSPNYHFPPNSQRFRGNVYVYNQKQRFGYARLIDKSVIWLDPAHFINKSYIPQLGDKISFEIKDTIKGKQARNICLVEDEKAFAPKTDVADTIKTVTPPKLTSYPQKRTFFNEPYRKKPKKTTPHSGTQKAQQLYQKAAIARTEGRRNDAIRLFRQTIDAGANEQVYRIFAKMLDEGGNKQNKQEARQVIEQAIDRFPYYANLYVFYGQMERRSKNYAKAEEIFQRGLRKTPSTGLQAGLAQILVQKGTDESLNEAGQIYKELIKKRKIDKRDGYYQRYIAFERVPRANKAYDFFKEYGMKTGIAGKGNLPKGNKVTDIVVDIQSPELRESFGLSDAVLIRCFRNSPRRADLVTVQNYLRSFGPKDILGTQESGTFIIDKTLAFIAVENSDHIRDQIMSFLSENGEAIVPLEYTQLENSDDPLQVLRDTLYQYLGNRDLYSGNLPVSGRRFFGREKLLRELAHQIQMGQFLGIYGLRKMGKTSILYQLRDQALQTEAIAYVDLQASTVLSEHNCNPLYWELERDLYKRLNKSHPDLAGLLRLGKKPRFSEFSEQEQHRIRLLFSEDMHSLLDKIYKGHPIKQLVIILDELELILPIGQKRVDGYLEFFGLLRGLAQTERYRGLISSIVVASNASISEKGYWEGRENPMFALYTPIFLSPFTIDECKEMICSLGKNMSVYWDEEALDIIFAETGGHPFLTRLFCSYIVGKHTVRPLRVNPTMIAEQITPFVKYHGDKFEQITELLKENFPDEEKFLEQIALDEIPTVLSDNKLHHLLNYGLIGLKDNKYYITLKLLRRWLRRRIGVKD